MSTRPSKYTKEVLAPIVESSFSWAQVLGKLGLSYTGGSLKHIRSKAVYFELSTSHFTSQAWNRGLTESTSVSVRNGAEKNRIPDSEVFKKNGHPLNSYKVKQRLLKSGWENKCQICGLVEWLGNPIALHLDHINGCDTDNRLENLRILCPNCHQQTDTWGKGTRSGRLLKLVDNAGLDLAGEIRGGSNPSPPTT